MASKKSAKTLLRLRVPKLNTRGPLAFEQFLANLHGLLSKAARQARDESISFEIVNLEGRIYFYIIVPSHLKTLVSSQLYSQYPQVEIDEAAEYLTKKITKGKNILTAELQPALPPMYPFKRYPQFEDKLQQTLEDPIGPITASLTHLHGPTDTAVVQFVINPIPTDWNKAAKNTWRRFFQPGIWKWQRWQRWYTNQRLSFNRTERYLKSPLWGLILMFAGWGRSTAEDSRQDDQMERTLDRESQTSNRHDRETLFSAGFDKISRLNFATNIRAIYLHSDPDPLHAEAKIREIAGSFQPFSLAEMNHFDIAHVGRDGKSMSWKNFIRRASHHPFALSQEELATMFHLPTEIVKTSGIHWIESLKLEPPANLPQSENNLTLIGQTNFRRKAIDYGIRPVDRRRHVYIIGKTGMGKSTLLENMIYSDIMAGKGVAVIDPHGDLAEAVIGFVPKHRTNDVVLFDPADKDFPMAFNMLEGKNPEHRALIASGLVGVFKKLYADSWGPRLEHFLRNTILALIEAPDTTMLGITRMLVDKSYRGKILHFVQDPMVRNFWETEFNALSPQKLAEAVGPIQNKVGQFLSAPIIRNIVGQPKSTLDLRFCMDKGKIVIVNLSKGKIGEDNSAMLGSLLITKFQLDAMSRADIPESERRDFSLFVDEFQNFATESFATILSEARKYKLSLTMANQYLEQMTDEVSAAVFGNVGSLISFQVGINDAKILAEQFDENIVEPIHLATIPKYQIYNRIMVDGLTTPTFSAKTFPPPDIDYGEETMEERIEKIRNFSRQRYTKPRDKIEEKIMRWSRSENEKKKSKKDKEKGK